MRNSLLGLLLLAFPLPALAQVTPGPGPGALPLTSAEINRALLNQNVDLGTGGVTAAGSTNLSGAVSLNFPTNLGLVRNVTGNLTGLSSTLRPNYLYSMLNSSGSTGVTWENNFKGLELQSGTYPNEVNGDHSFVLIDAGVAYSAGTGENYEASTVNYGVVTGSLYQYLALYDNKVGATISGIAGIKSTYTNANTTAGSIAAWVGLECDGFSGGGGTIASDSACLKNTDPTARISTYSYLSFRAASPPVVSGCGTSPSLDGFASNSTGVVTEGTNATGCTITFSTSFSVSGNNFTPHCVVSSPNGAVLSGYSVSVFALTITNASASGNQYSWFCTGSL